MPSVVQLLRMGTINLSAPNCSRLIGNMVSFHKGSDKGSKKSPKFGWLCEECYCGTYGRNAMKRRLMVTTGTQQNFFINYG